MPKATKAPTATYRARHDGHAIAIRVVSRDGEYRISHTMRGLGRTPELTFSHELYAACSWHGMRVDAVRNCILAQDPATAVEGFGRAQRLAEQYVAAIELLRKGGA